jgi:hypothetical protein
MSLQLLRDQQGNDEAAANHRRGKQGELHQ